jgi:Arabinose-binding domain of AraC transcription regulator, N-term
MAEDSAGHEGRMTTGCDFLTPGDESVKMVRFLLTAATTEGTDPRRLARDAGLPDWVHCSDDVMISPQYALRLWELAEQALEDPQLPLTIAARYQEGEPDLYDYLFLTAPTLRDGCGSPPDGGLLADLDKAELAEVRARTAHVREATTGYRRGSPELAAPGEPRPEYGPGTSLVQRYRAKAAELGVGERTIRRWATELESSGPAGLIDARRVRRQAPEGGADAQWLAMARTVLAEHAQESTPTRDLILARIAARLEAEHGPGAVRVPGRTRALALLREISRGTSAFGGAKARREIAGRPPGPYGRLRSARPGEYLLDTTRLDVFAMDPVTLRWVQAELTIAMDLYDRCITGLRVTPVSTKAIDAAAVLFESVRPLPDPEGLLAALPGYKGPDVHRRGKSPEE